MNLRNNILKLPSFWRKMIYGSIPILIPCVIIIGLYFMVLLAMFISDLPTIVQILLGFIIISVIVYILGDYIDRNINK